MKAEEVSELCQNGIYEGSIIDGELIETHISWVILTKEYAFKIKKPMEYSFLNFSNLESRKYFCEQELKLNRRLSDIYLDVLPIRKKGNHFHVGSRSGHVIDYTVRMKKMKRQKQMNLMLKRNEVDELHMRKLAKKIAKFHNNAEKVFRKVRSDKMKSDFNDILSVSDWVKSELGEKEHKIIKAAVQYSNSFIKSHLTNLNVRIKNGFQRDVHGDLHSKNIFLYSDPVIFDCIEFNEEFRQIDVLNEIAFFCMDLEANEKKKLSNSFLNYYKKEFNCMDSDSDNEIFIYYKVYRSNVRAKVNALRALQEEDKNAELKLRKEVRRYIDLMDSYMNA